MDTSSYLPSLSAVIFFITFTYKIAESASGVSTLQQLLSGDNQGRPFDAIEDQKSIQSADDQEIEQLIQGVRLANLLQQVQETSKGSKRVFCNNELGCISNKRMFTPNPRRPRAEKRVFCNGFFGCRSGKRSKSMSLVEAAPLPDVPEPSAPQKRLFCNINGCGNGKKRALYDALFDSLSSDKDMVVEDRDLQVAKQMLPHQITYNKNLNDKRMQGRSYDDVSEDRESHGVINDKRAIAAYEEPIVDDSDDIQGQPYQGIVSSNLPIESCFTYGGHRICTKVV